MLRDGGGAALRDDSDQVADQDAVVEEQAREEVDWSAVQHAKECARRGLHRTWGVGLDRHPDFPSNLGKS